MIIQGHRQSGFKTAALRARGWYALRGLGQALPNFSPGQWYELIALAENQPLSDVQAYYSQTATGSNITNLDVVLGQWPGGIAHSGYLQYQSGGVVDAPAGSGHYFQYAGGYVSWAKTASVNPWAIPAQAPTAQQIATQQAASTAQYQQQMSAPVYSQPQNLAAVIAAYNAANPQAPAPMPPTVVNPSPASQSTSTGTAATSTTSAVSQANGQISAGTSTVNQGTFDLTSLLGGTDWIPGVPNVALVIGAAGALVLLIASSGKGR